MQRRSIYEFDDPQELDSEYNFVYTDELRKHRTVEIAPELPGLSDNEWNRLETALDDTNVCIVQRMRNDFTLSSDAFHGIHAAAPEEALDCVNSYVRISLGSDGSIPTITNT